MNDQTTSHLFNTLSADKWRRIGTRKRCGVLAPLFSVYSQDSTGIGEFPDIKLLVDWCIKTGNSILQLLPMNEVGPVFCPYDSISSFALEPMYVRLKDIPGVSKEVIAKEISRLKKEFPAGTEYVNYRIKQEKQELLWDIFNETNVKLTRDFEAFIDANAYWLDDFALFSFLKAKHGGKAWWDWPQDLKERDPHSLKKIFQNYDKEILFVKWVQWQLFKQFKEVKDYARGKNILIKGDLPILVSRDSADVWAHPHFFKMDLIAGAPPDMYCAKGQRWGTPIYNWEKIFADNGTYVKEKLHYAENFYDILRIDHVVGLFRIWSIPYNEPQENQGLNGFFDPRDDSLWEAQGKKILSLMLEYTNMLLCAEDLGVVPYQCTKTLKEFGIPGNDVQRWVKDWDKRHDFLRPDEYRDLSVAVLSTHDTTNWPGWWENEAGTVDEGLFKRRCIEQGIDYEAVRARLFDQPRSKHGRLRWQDDINSVDVLVAVLARPKEQLWHFIDMYQNTYAEKQKLWKALVLKDPVRESFDKELVRSITAQVLASHSIFFINLITDWLYLDGMLKQDAYKYRINTPGTVTPQNWSLTMPLSLEELLKHKVTKQIKDVVLAVRP